ncbi:MAG: OpgC domain-containing protein [Alphaproteobacteria bacterium]|nr:OpgC domain-containing protein [Alphaproteobacteria bacterium]
MSRQANPVDFWRGLALVAIFINHIPGIYYSRFTHANYSISDSADLFVFLAGWAMRYMVGSPGNQPTAWYIVLRVSGRALTLYAAQVMITMVAIAMLAGVALWRDNPLLLEWHNAAAIFQDPVPTHVGLALLTHQLGYFDILPLYVVLMMAAPVIVLIDRYAPNWLLPISLLVYAVTLTFRISVPTWPVEGGWFFNPLAWQLVFVLGFVLAREDGVGGFVRRHIFPIRLIALPIVVAGLFVVLYNWWPDPTKFPQPRLFFLLSKTYVTPPRIIQFLALIAVMSVTYPYILRFASRLVEVLSMLGRNSLYVFCMGSILSLAGQIIRFIFQGNIAVDTAVVIFGIAILVFTAWLPEWRESFKARRGTRVSSLASSPAPAS